jgi:hypothetical protein
MGMAEREVGGGVGAEERERERERVSDRFGGYWQERKWLNS